MNTTITKSATYEKKQVTAREFIDLVLSENTTKSELSYLITSINPHSVYGISPEDFLREELREALNDLINQDIEKAAARFVKFASYRDRYEILTDPILVKITEDLPAKHLEKVEEFAQLIGKKVRVNITGMVVNGVIVDIEYDKYGVMINIKHDPVRWGDNIYTKSSNFYRFCDGWGSWKSIEVIN